MKPWPHLAVVLELLSRKYNHVLFLHVLAMFDYFSQPQNQVT